MLIVIIVFYVHKHNVINLYYRERGAVIFLVHYINSKNITKKNVRDEGLNKIQDWLQPL